MPRVIDRDEVQRLMDHGAQLIDVLPKKEYAESHLPGAINISLQSLNEKPSLSCERTVRSLSTVTITKALEPRGGSTAWVFRKCSTICRGRWIGWLTGYRWRKK